jgi:dolichyl-phosphate beta-glucosyltransferase
MPSEPSAVAPRVSIILPAYNEAHRIEPALQELFGYLRRDGPPRRGGRSARDLGRVEVVVVDDGSSDGTAAMVDGFATGLIDGSPQLRLLREPHAGKGGAVRAGMLAAQGEFVVFTDADMATPPDQLPLLVEALATHDLALGSRIQPNGVDRRASQPLRRRLMGKVFHLLAAALVTGPVPDTQCGFKGFRREVARDLFGRQQLTSIVFDAEIIHLARKRGYTMVSVPVEWTDKTGSRMQVRLGLALRVLIDLVRIPRLHRGVPRA